MNTSEGQDSEGRHFGRPVRVFPNPFQDQFSVVLNDYYPQNAQLLVYDELGRRIYQQRIFHGWDVVDGSNWPIGLYFYELWDDGRRLASGKVVKAN